MRLADNRQTNGTYGMELTFRAAAGAAYQICLGNNETDAFYGGVEFYLGLALTPAPANNTSESATSAIMRTPRTRAPCPPRLPR